MIRPDVNFDVKILEELGFEKCHTCFNKKRVVKTS